MPFITLHDGSRRNLAYITGYVFAITAGGSWLHTTYAPTSPENVAETPDQLDALIRAAVLDEEHALQLTRLSAEEAIYQASQRRCRVCGCTDDRACAGGCSWVEADLCSTCQEKLQHMAPSPTAAAMDVATGRR